MCQGALTNAFKEFVRMEVIKEIICTQFTKLVLIFNGNLSQ